jgi:hypothetical protein
MKTPPIVALAAATPAGCVVVSAPHAHYRPPVVVY